VASREPCHACHTRAVRLADPADHDDCDLQRAPRLASLRAGEMEAEGAGGGWSRVLSDVESLLETGGRLTG